MSRVVCSDEYDVFYNLALEEALTKTVEKTSMPLLLLWQNKDTVVIGRNQNAYVEVNLEYAKKNNISVARRKTGGGTVFHDLGNLNYSFIIPKSQYRREDVDEVLLESLKSIGISAKLSGKNDITVNGKKISGNAFRSTDKMCLHHGTILVNVSLEKMKNVLSTEKSKFFTKTIRSNRSFVENLSSISDEISVEGIIRAIKKKFEEKYGKINDNKSAITNEEAYLIEKYYSEITPDEWNIGLISSWEVIEDKQFDWGFVEISIHMEKENMEAVSIISDTIHVEIVEKISDNLNQKNSSIFSQLKNEYKDLVELQVIQDIEELYNRTISKM